MNNTEIGCKNFASTFNNKLTANSKILASVNSMLGRTERLTP